MHGDQLSATTPNSQLVNRCKQFQTDNSAVEVEYGNGRNRVLGTIIDANSEYLEFEHKGTDRVSLVQWWAIEAITLLPAAALSVGKGR